MNVTGNVMTMKHFVDFYMLEAMRAGIGMAKSARPENQFRHSVERLENDVNEAFDSLSKTMAFRIYIYLWGAALGEAVYAHENCEWMIEEIHENSFGYRDTFDFFPTEHNVDMVKEVFGQDWASGGYGGDAWKEIVEGMELYGKITDAAFIDHCVDLEHNGGCVFNKTGRSPFLLDCFDMGFSGTELHRFLDRKFSMDILNELTTRYEVSSKVYRLLTRYSNVIGKADSVKILRPSLEWLSPYEVEWNDGAFDAKFTWVEADIRRTCNGCGCTMSEYEENYLESYDATFCNDCVETCENCNEVVHKDDSQWVDGEHETWCDNCANDHMATCEECNYDFHTNNTVYTEDEHTVCEKCANNCVTCGDVYFDMEEHEESHKDENEAEEVGEPLPETVKKIKTEITMSNSKPVETTVWTIPNSPLKVIDFKKYKQNKGEHVGTANPKYVVLAPFGLWFSYKNGKNLEDAIEIAKKVTPMAEWENMTTPQDWWDAPKHVVNSIMKVVGG